jgi:hypothetical protein
MTRWHAVRPPAHPAGTGARPGTGTGRIGWPFVPPGDFYVGLDLSLGSCVGSPNALGWVRCWFRVFASFDAVILVQVFSGAPTGAG